MVKLKRTRAVAFLLAVVLLIDHTGADPPDFSWLPAATKLPAPAGEIIRVATVEALFEAADNVQPGGTILLADGHYMMPRYFELSTHRVTLRSTSGDRNNVILDGAESRHGELVGVRACSGVIIADLTIQNIRHNGFKINSDTGVQCVTIRNCVIHNIWQRGVKGVRVPADHPRIKPPKDCYIEHCLFYNDRPKRFQDDSTDTPDSFDGNYIGGIDVMYADSWTIRDNVFFGIRGRTGAARGAVFLWHDSADCIIERNVIIDCDAGICLGNSHRAPGTRVHCWRCTVRNNFVTRCPENGILADFTKDCVIAHNTIHDPASQLGRLIRLVHDNEGLAVVNNILSGPPMRVETESSVRFESNITRDGAEWFRDLTKGDLHLNGNLPKEVTQVASMAQVQDDFDRERRGSSTCAGADQRSGKMAEPGDDQMSAWAESSRKVHGRFSGESGTFAQFGDSITDSRAFWFSLKWKRGNASDQMSADFELVRSYMLDDCWDRKGSRYGNQSGQTVSWASRNLDTWLRQWNPEVAILMFGSNDLGSVTVEDYEATLEDVVKRCLDNGTVVILSTIPPRHGYEEKSSAFATAARRVAETTKVPLTDFHAEILRRRPNDWDGTLEKFHGHQGYDVPTLIARDGVHPSNPKRYQSDYSQDALANNGFSLRNYLVLRKYAEVIREVLE